MASMERVYSDLCEDKRNIELAFDSEPQEEENYMSAEASWYRDRAMERYQTEQDSDPLVLLEGHEPMRITIDRTPNVATDLPATDTASSTGTPQLESQRTENEATTYDMTALFEAIQKETQILRKKRRDSLLVRALVGSYTQGAKKLREGETSFQRR